MNPENRQHTRLNARKLTITASPRNGESEEWKEELTFNRDQATNGSPSWRNGKRRRSKLWKERKGNDSKVEENVTAHKGFNVERGTPVVNQCWLGSSIHAIIHQDREVSRVSIRVVWYSGTCQRLVSQSLSFNRFQCRVSSVLHKPTNV